MPLARLRTLSLSIKLTLAFLLVGILGAVLVALFVGQRTQREFDRFILDSYQANVVTSLQRYYEEHGSWEGLSGSALRTPYRHQDPMMGMPTIISADGRLIMGGRHALDGPSLSPHEQSQTIPIQVNGQIVGWVRFRMPPQLPPSASPEAAFLHRVRLALIWGALGASLIALLVGAVLARSITRPIKALTTATRRVARGELGLQVPVQSQDELGELAQSFNLMSHDLAEASQLRRQMTADIAHDLRTPLTVILGYTEAMADGKMAGNPAIFTAMHEEAQHLQHLVEDLRLLSLADAGELTLHRQPMSPQQLLERLHRAHQLQARQQGIELTMTVAPDLPELQLDPERMTQVLNNLISNALHHTPAGGQVRLGARRIPTGAQISIQDTGSGIAPEDLPHIFERHYRGDKARNYDTGASGLGLAIAKAIVELHGGRIDVQSKLGEGTLFTIDLPLDETS